MGNKNKPIIIKKMKKVWKMYAQAEKSKGSRCRTVANSVAQKRGSGKQRIRFVDNRSKYTFPLQLKKYIVERNIKLDIGKKEWKGNTTQVAKTRARGESIRYLREIYPSKNDETRDQAFHDAVKLLDKKYQLSGTETKEDTAISTRAAIYGDAPEGKRSGGSQADRINKLIHKDDFIGAHLIKREWGGADNMWNVVAWLGTAESKWANSFERPVDMKGVFGENPGQVSIKVTKEDEHIDANAYQKFIKETDNINKTGYEYIAASRANINRAIESVPLDAEGKNYKSTTRLDANEIGFSKVTSLADGEFIKKIEEAKNITEERSDYNGNKPIPENITDADKIEEAKRLEERKRDWKNEKDTYDKGAGKGAFLFTNTLFDEGS